MDFSTPEKTLESYFNALRTNDMVEEDKLSKSFLSLVRKAEYQLNQKTIIRNIANLEIKIRAVDMIKYMSELMEKITPLILNRVSEEEILDFFDEFWIEIANSSGFNFVDKDFIVELEKNDDGWEIINPDDIVIPLLG